MRYIVYGAGAVGGVIGATLFEHGHDVVFIARGDHLAALQRDGLVFSAFDGERHLQVPTVGHPSELTFGDDDVVLLTVKTQDTDEALRALEPAAGPDIPIVCCQNGVENERLASRRFAEVYGIYVTIFATFLKPGHVTAAAQPVLGIVDVGRYPAGANDLTRTVAADLESARISSRSREDVMRWKYGKLLTNLNGSLAAICEGGEAVKQIRAALSEEGARVLERAGVSYADRAEQDARRESVRMTVSDRSGGSVWQSVARHTGAVESDYLNGEIVLLGRLHGEPTPYNEAVRRMANLLAREAREPGSIPVEELLALLERLGAASPDLQPAERA